MPVQLIRSKRHGDARGWFTETYNRETFVQLGINSIDELPLISPLLADGSEGFDDKL